jgi:hypothetical protein
MPNTGNYGWYVVGAIAVIAVAVAWSLRGSHPQDEPGVSDHGPDAHDRSHDVSRV